MKKLIAALSAFTLLLGASSFAPNEAIARGAKSVTVQVNGWTVRGKKCLLKKRCDFKLFVKKSPGVYTREVHRTPKSLAQSETPKGLHGYGGGGHWRGRGPGWGYGPRYGPGPDLGTAVVGGIIGGAVVNWWNRPEPPPPPPPPPPPEPEPAPPPQGAGAVVLDPFTGPWYEWCAGKYKSFDAKTGTWTDNDGQKHFCGQ